MSQEALGKTSPGKLINLLSNDLSRFDLVFYCVHGLWIGPVVTITATYILWIEIQWAGIVGVGVILFITLIQSTFRNDIFSNMKCFEIILNLTGFVAKMSANIRFETAKRTDERVRFMDQIISGVQVIKMYAWEEPFSRVIAEARRSELKMVLKNGHVQTIHMISNILVFRMALFSSVLTIILLNGRESITVSKMFMLTSLYTPIAFAMNHHFLNSMTVVGGALVAIRRLQTFLENEEKEENNEAKGSDLLMAPKIAIFMKNVSAGWNENTNMNNVKKPPNSSHKETNPLISNEVKPFMLKHIDVEIQKGNLVFVIGPVGSGKSTLIQVLLRELPLVCGSIGINGSISYASSESWIFDSNIRQNITFGQAMDQSRYDEVIRCTDLNADFKQLSEGDLTLVGENGMGLSGGQKARVK